MSTPPLTDEQCLEAIAAVARHHGSHQRAAEELGLKSVHTLKSRLRKASERGFSKTDPVMPGFRIARVSTTEDASGAIKSRSITQKPDMDEVSFAIPQGHRVKGVSALVDGNGNVVQSWYKTREGERDPEATAAKIREIFEGMAFTVPPVPGPETTDEDCVTLFNIPDAHMGLYVWGDEASENWDLKKADRIYRKTFGELVAMTPRNKTAILLAGGDQMHADNSQNRTEKSGHTLDVDGRFERVLETTCYLFLHFATLTLQTHENLIIRVLKGNHDPHASAALAYFLLAAFRDNPRVTVDVSPSLFWVYQHGKVMLAATHGHEAKAERMPAIMASRWPEIWGSTQYRYAHTFHVHHRQKIRDKEMDGVYVETHQSPAPQDGWHYGQGFLSGRSLRSIIYHRELGEYGGATRPVCPE